MTIISVRNVSKMYSLYDKPQDRLNQSLWHALPSFLRGKSRQFYREFWALHQVSFAVKRGEMVGVIGRNGSGKSTLLQIIAGTLTPTTGEVHIKGRVAALLELGTGFNPEFTGRENVFLNGTIVGLSRGQMAYHLDEILAFADIGQFIDQPIKFYSSGMLVRLAFAVNACIEPDILIVDEALSVGDMYFQAKCMARIDKLRQSGVTILFVSHSLQTVRALCDRALLLEQGRALAFGGVEQVTDLYSASNLYQKNAEDMALDPPAASSNGLTFIGKTYISKMQPSFLERVTERTGKGYAQFYECCIFQNNQEVDIIVHGQPCTVMAWLEHKTDLNEAAEVGILVRNLAGLELFAINSYFLAQPKPYPPKKKGEKTHIAFHFPVELAPGVYTITLGLRVPEQGEYWDKVFNAAIFQVVTKPGDYVPGLFKTEGMIEYHLA